MDLKIDTSSEGIFWSNTYSSHSSFCLSITGITWHTLHILDHRSYWAHARHDYIPLPLHARTRNTRVRWWQLLGVEDSTPMGWTLDNVYIGGSEINPSHLYEDFEGAVDETEWEFYPNGRLWSGLCARPSSAIAWNGKPGLQSLTTGQLIVQEGYMLQFMVCRIRRCW